MATGDVTGEDSSGREWLRIGSHVTADDGDCGELVRVVIEPVARALTHVVVAPRHHPGLGKLVPIGLVQPGDGGAVRLSCTLEHFHQLDDAEDIHFLPAETDTFGHGSDALIWPHFGLGMPLGPGHHEPMLDDRVPAGEVQIRRGDAVHASDGPIGSVQGLVIYPGDHRVTHVLLKEGHVWGRKQVAIPIAAATRVGAVLRVGMTKQEIGDLPAVELR